MTIPEFMALLVEVNLQWELRGAGRCVRTSQTGFCHCPLTAVYWHETRIDRHAMNGIHCGLDLGLSFEDAKRIAYCADNEHASSEDEIRAQLLAACKLT
jgi:hypothetical protein